MKTFRYNAITTLLFCIALFCVAQDINAQEGKYVRKSISTSGVLWNNEPDIPHIRDINMNIHAHIVVENLFLDRFDYNILPENTLTRFYNSIKRESNLNINRLGEIINKTLKKDILSILNDPEVQRLRGRELLSETDIQRFAAVKAKSFGMTAEKLEVLLNTAYIYMPYIDEVEYDKDPDMHYYDLKGGILWYKIVVGPNGSSGVILVKKIKAEGFGGESISGKNYFTLNKKYWKTNNYETAFHDALNSFYYNLSVKTKELIDFKLKGQVEEVGSRKAYINLGNKEGLHLDDMFFLMKAVESEEEIKYERVAVMRVNKTGNNLGSRNERTKLKKVYGKKIKPGLIAVEHPRFGEEYEFNLRYMTNYNFKPDGFESPMNGALGIRLLFGFNLAPVKGISQYYEEIELYLDNLTSSNLNNNHVAWEFGAFYNRKRKFGFGRSYVGLGLGAGANAISYKINAKEEEDKKRGGGLVGKVFGEIGFHLSPDWILKGETVLRASTIPGIHGIGFTFGLRKSIKQSSVFLFGFRKSQKKY